MNSAQRLMRLWKILKENNMKITKLTLENFKMFRDRQEFDLSSMNFLIGENNTGKTAVIEALDYLVNGPAKDKIYKNKNCTVNENISIEAIVDIGSSEVDAKYISYVYEDNGQKLIKIKRSTKEEKIKQNGKDVDLNEKKILCWSSANMLYENPAGKDTTFNVIEIVPIYAKNNIGDVVSFDGTKVLGKLIKGSVGDFFESDEYRNFKSEHDKVFNTGEKSLKSRLNSLSQNISSVLREQWGEANLSFTFDVLENSNHLKNGNILVNENGEEYRLEDKGSGFQRTVMLSMLQVLSNITLSNLDNNIVLCIDEPELNLHPKAQEKLIEAIHMLSEKIQVIVTTHSPYILKHYKKEKDTVYVFKDSTKADISKLDKVSVLPFGPTLAEVQYFAYNLIPNDFHNELYGYLESESKLSFTNSKKWFNEKLDKEENVSLQKYIRNSIHHPENKKNNKPTEDEIRQSIKEMIKII